MNHLIIAEHDNKKLFPATHKTIQAANQLTGDKTLLIIGHQCQTVVDAAQMLEGVNKILVADAPAYEHFLAENVSELIKTIGKDFSHIFAPATTLCKNFMPRVAALLDVAQISDIIGIKDEATFTRPIYAGNVIAQVKSNDPIKVITVRPTAFAEAKVCDSKACVENLDIIIDNTLSEFVSHELTESDRPELTSARVVVSGGRGLQNRENFQIIEELAKQLNAAIGASRAAVDAGFVPNDYQVGQTGKVVAPDLYIAIGISGAIQHLAGMKDSKVIVAINKDADAPIFKIADYGLVGDLFEIIPELTKELMKQ